MTTSTPGRRGARLKNDPNRYVRAIRGRFQARMYDPRSDGGVGRINLGCYDTAAEAARAITDFIHGRLKPKLKWARPVARGDMTAWIAVVRLPRWVVRVDVERRKSNGKRVTVRREKAGPTVRLPGDHATAESAHAAARAWLVANLGLLGWYLTVAPDADLRTYRAA